MMKGRENMTKQEVININMRCIEIFAVFLTLVASIGLTLT